MCEWDDVLKTPKGDNLLVRELSTHSGCTEVHYKERNCSNYSGIHWQSNFQKRNMELLGSLDSQFQMKRLTWKMIPLKCAFFSGEFHHHEMVTAVISLTKFVPVTCQPLSKQEGKKET